MKPTLVVLAAGIGNRYGGLKQMDGVGPAGETIVDYSIYDAAGAGFGKVVFVIRRSIEQEFREVFLRKLEGKIDVDCVFQELGDVPPGFSAPPGRTKPWGTTQAVLAARSKIGTPFAAINADDFYGREAFRMMAGFLGGLAPTEPSYALVGYELESTLSEHGTVARGVCEVDGEERLKSIVERLGIERSDSGISYAGDAGVRMPLPGGKTVSMNFWGFTPTFFGFAGEAFERFLRERAGDPKAELYIPLVVNDLLRTGRAKLKVLPSRQKWFGVTYREDRPLVVAELRKLTESGQYPSPLWR